MDLFTGVHVVHALAASAVDVAAPDKFALTALDVPHHMSVVASAAAKQVAAIRASGGPVAAAPPGAGDATPPVLQAVVWRLVQVDEFVFVHKMALVLFSGLPPGPVRHLDAALVSLLQEGTDTLERRHGPPAGLHCAGTRNTVAATVCGHGRLDGLQEDRDTGLEMGSGWGRRKSEPACLLTAGPAPDGRIPTLFWRIREEFYQPAATQVDGSCRAHFSHIRTTKVSEFQEVPFRGEVEVWIWTSEAGPMQN